MKRLDFSQRNVLFGNLFFFFFEESLKKKRENLGLQLISELFVVSV